MADDFGHDHAAYEMGFKAAQETTPILSNPFDNIDEASQWYAWRCGWHDGHLMHSRRAP